MSQSTFSAPPPTTGAQYPEREKVYVPEGTNHAVCIGVAFLGHYEKEFKGVAKTQQLVRLFFEFPNDVVELYDENGNTGEFKPLVLSREFTYSFDARGHLRKFIETFYGKQFTDEQANSIQLHKLIGRNGIATIMYETGKDGKTYEKINSVAPLMKGMENFKPANEIKSFSYAVESYGGSKEAQKAEFEKLPNFVKKAFRNSNEYQTGNLSHLESAQPAASAPTKPAQATVVSLQDERKAAELLLIKWAQNAPKAAKSTAATLPPQPEANGDDDLPF